MMLDFAALQGMALPEGSFQWGRSNLLVPGVLSEELARTFPVGGFLQHERLAGSDKTYRIDIRHAMQAGEAALVTEGLSRVWKQFLRELAAPTYRTTIARLTGLNLDSALMEIMFNRYGPSDWLSPHTDKYPKLATQIFYFSGDWPAEWGGNLVILEDGPGAGITRRVIPRTGESVIILRSDCSWHAVEPVSDRATRPRLSLQINFWAGGIPDAPPGRRLESPAYHESRN